MAKYTKKPIIIEARQLKKYSDLHELVKWINSNSNNTIAYVQRENFSDTLKIKTLEGVMTVDYNDYVIKGVANEFYPCKPNIFEATYELVEE